MARAKNQKIKKAEDVDVLFLRLFSELDEKNKEVHSGESPRLRVEGPEKRGTAVRGTVLFLLFRSGNDTLHLCDQEHFLLWR